MTATMQRAFNILSMFTEEELNGFIMMFSGKETQNGSAMKEETKEERIARKMAAHEHIISSRIHLPEDFDYKKELQDYRDERYGV